MSIVAHVEVKQDPVFLLDINPFCVPCFLFVGNRFNAASLTFSEFQTGKRADAEVKEE